MVDVDEGQHQVRFTLPDRVEAVALAAAVAGVAPRLTSSLGRWTLFYDLIAVRSFDVTRAQVLIDFHRRLRERLGRVGFCAAVPAVRGSAIVVGSSVRELPYRVLASAEALSRWVNGGGSP
jgi:hypothetical protein